MALALRCFAVSDFARAWPPSRPMSVKNFLTGLSMTGTEYHRSGLDVTNIFILDTVAGTVYCSDIVTGRAGVVAPTPP